MTFRDTFMKAWQLPWQMKGFCGSDVLSSAIAAGRFYDQDNMERMLSISSFT